MITNSPSSPNHLNSSNYVLHAYGQGVGSFIFKKLKELYQAFLIAIALGSIIGMIPLYYFYNRKVERIASKDSRIDPTFTQGSISPATTKTSTSSSLDSTVFTDSESPPQSSDDEFLSEDPICDASFRRSHTRSYMIPYPGDEWETSDYDRFKAYP